MLAAGFPGVLIPTEYGGSMLGLETACGILERLSQWCSGTPLVLTSTWTVALPLQLGGTAAMKNRWLPAFASGRAQACFAVTEVGAGNDVGGIQTTVSEDGDGFLVSGEKWFAGNAAKADLFLIVATREEGSGSSGTCILLVERGAEGLEVLDPIDKMGLRAAVHSPIRLTNVRVPREALLAEGSQAFRLLMRTIDMARPLTSASCLGIARAALDASVAYALQRQTFGRVIASRQSIQRLLANMAVEIEAASALTYSLVRDIDAHFEQVATAMGPTPYTARAAMSKLYTSRMVAHVATAAVQILGAQGYVKGNQVERLFRDSRAAELYEGTSEIQELIIARALLKATDPAFAA
jgi:alkylation response protein AidB-like acyl-CoA dehydrogenase